VAATAAARASAGAGPNPALLPPGRSPASVKPAPALAQSARAAATLGGAGPGDHPGGRDWVRPSYSASTSITSITCTNTRIACQSARLPSEIPAMAVMAVRP
jgi:hypothetical protein